MDGVTSRYYLRPNPCHLHNLDSVLVLTLLVSDLCRCRNIRHMPHHSNQKHSLLLDFVRSIG